MIWTVLNWLRVGVTWFALFVGVAFSAAALEIATMEIMCRTVGIGCQSVIYSW